MGKSKQEVETARDVILLRVFVGQDEVEHHALTKDKIVIGRDPYADIYLEDAKISRVHATIERERNGLVFHDRSTNGVLINGTRTQSHPIRHGDEIAIGRFRIGVEIHVQTDSNYFDAARASGLGIDVEHTLRAPTDHLGTSLGDGKSGTRNV